MSTYTIFVGVNGAGKTLIYKSIYYNENKDENVYLKQGKIVWTDKKMPKWINGVLQR